MVTIRVPSLLMRVCCDTDVGNATDISIPLVKKFDDNALNATKTNLRNFMSLNSCFISLYCTAPSTIVIASRLLVSHKTTLQQCTVINIIVSKNRIILIGLSYSFSFYNLILNHRGGENYYKNIRTPSRNIVSLKMHSSIDPPPL